MRIFIVIILLFLSIQLLQAQSSKGFQLNFEPMFNEQHLVLNDAFYHINPKDSIQISKLKFYICTIQFYNNNKLVFTEKNSYHLVDVSNSNSLHININKPYNIKYDVIKFNLGIDSITNSKGALGGDLDPTKGMYWAWHSGYINFKLEGTSNLCNTRNNAFEFHLGGFAAPNNSLQTIKLSSSKIATVNILVDVNKFLSQINLAITYAIMTPSKEAIELSEIAVSIFNIKQ